MVANPSSFPSINELRYQRDECVKVAASFEFFLDAYVYIEDKQTKRAIKLELWDSQRSVLPKYLDERLVIIIKAHQLGYTWIMVACYCLWRAITKPLEHIVVNSFNEDVGIEILKRLDFIKLRLPTWLVPPIVKETTQTIEFEHLDKQNNAVLSIIQVIPATTKGSQSKTPTCLIIDESAQNRYVAQTYMASKPGIDSANGKIVIISNSIKDAPGWPFTRSTYQGSMKGENSFNRIFLPWQAHPGRSGDFKAHQLNEGMTEEDFSQRYPETEDEAISVLTGSYFGRTLARHNEYLMPGVRGRIEMNAQKEIEFKEEKNGILEVWRWPYKVVKGYDNLQWELRYVIGSDISEGLGESYSVAYVLDRHLGQIVARLRSNRIDAYSWANTLHLLSQWYDNGLVVPERTGAGITTVKILSELNANLYRQSSTGTVGEPLTKQLGWGETEQAKHELCGDLRNWLGTAKLPALFDAHLIDECSTFIRHDNGRLGPEEGALGDCVIAAGLAIEGDIWLGEKPKTIPVKESGWLQRWKEGKL